MPDLLNAQGEKQFVPEEELEARLSEGYKLDPGTEYDVVTPEGEIKKLGGDAAELAVRYDGWGLAPQSAIISELKQEAQEEQFGGIRGEVASFGRSIGKGAFFGLVGTDEESQKFYEENPRSALAGELIGTVLPALVPGAGEAKAAAGTFKAAGETAELAARELGIGSRIASYTPAGMAARLETGIASRIAPEGAGLVASAAGHAVGGAAYGAAYGGTSYIGEVLNTDAEFSAEQLVSEMGADALYGGLVGGAAPVVGAAVKGGYRAAKGIKGKLAGEGIDGAVVTRKLAADREMLEHFDEVSKNAFSAVEQHIDSTLDGIPAADMIKRAEPAIPGVAGRRVLPEWSEFSKATMKKAMAESGGDMAAAHKLQGSWWKPIKQAHKIEAQMGEMRAARRSFLSAVDDASRKDLPDHLALGAREARPPDVFDDIGEKFPFDDDDVLGLWNSGGTRSPRLMRELNKYVNESEKLSAMLDELEGVGGKKSFLPDVKKSLADSQQLLGDIGKAADEGGAVARIMGHVKDGLVKKGLGVVGGSMLGGPAGGMLGYIIAKDAGAAISAHEPMKKAVAAIRKHAGKADSKIQRLVSPSARKLPRLPRGAALPAGDAVYDYVQSLLPEPHRPRAQEKQKRGDRASALKEAMQRAAQDPDGVREAVKSSQGQMNVAAPRLASSMADLAHRAISFLAAKMPADPRDPMQRSVGARWEPSAQQLEELRRYAGAVRDPLSIVDDAVAGRLTPQAVEAVRAVHPRTYERIRASVIDYASRLGDRLPYATRAQLSILLGADLDPTLEPQFVAAMQAPSEEPQAPPTRPTRLDLSMFGTASERAGSA